MKYLKALTLMLGGMLLLSSCDDKDKKEYNTNSGVYVSMEDSEISFREDNYYVNIPVLVSGAERNGYLTVTCTVKEVVDDPNADPAMEDVHYLMSDMSLTIAPEDNEGNFELKLVDDYVINRPRKFIVTLNSVDGAELGNMQQTYVTIHDNDKDPYMRLGGAWSVKGDDSKRRVLMVAYDSIHSGYKKYYGLRGLIDGQTIRAYFNYNEADGSGTITIPYGTELQKDLESVEYNGLELDDLYFTFGSYRDGNGEVTLEWSEDNRHLVVVGSPLGNYANFYLWAIYNMQSLIGLDSFTGVTEFYR